MYTYGLYNSKGTVLRCVSCLYKSQYFLLDFLLNIFFSVTFLIMRYTSLEPGWAMSVLKCTSDIVTVLWL